MITVRSERSPMIERASRFALLLGLIASGCLAASSCTQNTSPTTESESDPKTVEVASAEGDEAGDGDPGDSAGEGDSSPSDARSDDTASGSTTSDPADEDEVRGSDLGPTIPLDTASDPEGTAPGEGTLLDQARRKNATGKQYDESIAKKDEEALAKALAKVNTDADSVPITFKKISSYEYVEPKPGKPETLKKDQVPAEIKALNGKKVTMLGYMVPLDLTADHKVKLFFLASNTQACCFGQYPSIHEVVEVRVAKGAQYFKDEPVVITGKFEVGEDFDEYGYLLSLYRIEAASVKSAWDR